MGSSPRRRGAHDEHDRAVCSGRIIPAQAGSTTCPPVAELPREDHPRAGGEHVQSKAQSLVGFGSSPRRRGALVRRHAVLDDRRIILAQAGSTRDAASSQSAAEDHPRAGGEHLGPQASTGGTEGSSPRRRGAPTACLTDSLPGGSSPRRRGAPSLTPPPPFRSRIIPAQAGSTRSSTTAAPSNRDHPRAGGEHGDRLWVEAGAPGSSPRRRGAPVSRSPGAATTRIIPAQAGSTRPRPAWTPPPRDHPRAGGEHSPLAVAVRHRHGSSPRRRGARHIRSPRSAALRIIPAQAGSTGRDAHGNPAHGDHPRAGGEHNHLTRDDITGVGSSPRRRGARQRRQGRARARGIIPAQAGSTATAAGSRPRPWDHPRAGGEHSRLHFQ